MSHTSPDENRGSDDTRPEDAAVEHTDDAHGTDHEQGHADGGTVSAPSAAETDVIPSGHDQPTDRYTAPYPTVGGRADATPDASAERSSTQDGQSSSGRYGLGAQPSPYSQTQDEQSRSGQSQYGQGQGAQSQYGQDQTGRSQYSQYGQGQAGQGQTGQSQYGQGQAGQGQYGQSQNGQSQTGQYGQYGQSQYGQSQAGQSQYGQSQAGQSQYGPGQTGQSQYGQYGESQYGQQQRPRYGEYATGAAAGAAASNATHAAQPNGQGYAPGSAYAPASSQAPGSAYAPASSQPPTSAFGDVDGTSRANGHYFTGDPATGTTTGTRSTGSGRRLLIPAAALVVGALVGGVAGAGWVAASSDGGTTTSSSSSSQSSGNLTVNDYNSATVVTAVAAKATPSVVTINVSASSEAGTGSGVVVSKDGYIVTNTHVVTLDGDSGDGKISVTTSDGKIYAGKLVGTDPTVDLAVIKIDASDMQPISFADSSKLNVGDTAVAIGAPLGLSNTVTDGIVSTLNRSIQVSSSAPDSSGDSNEGGGNNGSGPYDFWGNGDNGSSSSSSTVSLPVIQTDASINPGNSGGALLDSKGRLIGINVAIASAGSSSSSDAQSGSIGVGFSIPSNLVERVSKQIIDTGSATHGLLGATVGDAASDANATQMGAAIRSVTAGGAAAEAGLQKGDVVTKIGSATVADATDLTAQVRYFAGGAKTEITYVRDGQQRTADVTLGTFKS